MIEAPAKLPRRTERLLEKSGRITPRQVLEAYEEIPFGVTFGTLHEGNAVCALGALMIRDGVTVEDMYRRGRLNACDLWHARIKATAGNHYAQGFADGFDGNPQCLNYPDERKGYLDGRRARRFVGARFGRLA